jgi:hypothetical protein
MTPHFEITLQGEKKILENSKEFLIFVVMEKMIYKFLDELIGYEVKCKELRKRGSSKVFRISSNKGYMILDFMVNPNTDNIILIGNNKLCEMVMSFFSIDNRTSLNYIRDWFGNVHGLNKVGDVRRFIPNNDKTPVLV